MTHRRWVLAGGGTLALVLLLAFGLPNAAAPVVAREGLWMGTVRQGEMNREVRAPGVLVPREFRWVAVETPARVERLVIRAGATVEPGSVILEMSNPALLDQKFAADAVLRAAEAELAARHARLDSEGLDRQAEVAGVQADYEQAKLQSEALTRALEMGVASRVQQRTSEVVAQGQERRLQIARQRFATHQHAIRAELAAERARIDQLRNTADLLGRQVEALKVKAGIAGVLQEIVVEAGQQVAAGANLARVAQQGTLMAQLRVAETQIREVRVGQEVAVDVRDGSIAGRVARIDPAVRSGTVLVDVELVGALPATARPDLNIDGTIRIERLRGVLFVERPANVQPGGSVPLFRLDSDGESAERVQVTLGRGSANTIEVVAGLRAGDRIVLSDTSQWNSDVRIALD
ncbi:MAG TPA: efflux RND transporter periplasmic adaptor subunit [Lysobacter sp.]